MRPAPPRRRIASSCRRPAATNPSIQATHRLLGGWLARKSLTPAKLPGSFFLARAVRLVLFVLLFAALGYSPGLGGPLIHDDLTNLGLVLVDVAGPAQAIDVSLSNGSGPLLRPLANFSFLVNYLVAGDGAFSFKLVNLLLHVISALLVYLLIAELHAAATRATKPKHPAGFALFIAAIWMAHPLHVSTVLYVVQRMTILSGIFSLGALVILARSLREPLSPTGQLRRSIAFLMLVGAGVLSKENAALTPLLGLPVAMLCCTAQVKRFVRDHAVLLSVSIALPVLVGTVGLAWKLESILAGYGYRNFTLVERLASESVILWKYLAFAAAPFPGWMQFFWDHEPVRQISDPIVLLAIASWLASFGIALACFRRSRLPLFCLLWFLLGHLMESSILPLELAYEHRNYLPLVGPIMLACAGLHWIGRRVTFDTRTAALAVLSVLMLLTGMRAFIWSSHSRLVAHEVKVSPSSLRAQVNSLTIAVQERRWDAVQHKIQTLRNLDPSGGWQGTLQLMSHCHGDPTPIDSESLRQELIPSALDVRAKRGVQQLVTFENQVGCLTRAGLSPVELLGQLAQTAVKQGVAATAAEYEYMAASLAWNRGDIQSSAKHIRRSIELAPEVSEPWERLISIELALGNSESASRALVELEEIWKARMPWRLYRLDGWRKLIQRASASNADT